MEGGGGGRPAEGLWDDPTAEGLWDAPASQGLWDDPTEALGDTEAVAPTAPPPNYSAENDCDDDLPPSYEECVRLGMAK